MQKIKVIFFILLSSIILGSVSFANEVCHEDKLSNDFEYYQGYGNQYFNDPAVKFTENIFQKFTHKYWERIKEISTYYDETKPEEEQSKLIKDNKNFIFNIMRPYVEAHLIMADNHFKSYGEMMKFIKNYKVCDKPKRRSKVGERSSKEVFKWLDEVRTQSAGVLTDPETEQMYEEAFDGIQYPGPQPSSKEK